MAVFVLLTALLGECFILAASFTQEFSHDWFDMAGGGDYR